MIILQYRKSHKIGKTPWEDSSQGVWLSFTDSIAFVFRKILHLVCILHKKYFKGLKYLSYTTSVFKNQDFWGKHFKYSFFYS